MTEENTYTLPCGCMVRKGIGGRIYMCPACVKAESKRGRR